MIVTRRHIALIALACVSLSAVGQNIWYWNQLPEKVATHFGLSGQPDAWMDRTRATLLMLGVQLGLPWLLVGIGLLTRFMPATLINIPHREYWLRPERRAYTLANLLHFVTVVAVTVALFMIAINHLTFVANMRGQALNLRAFAIVLVLYIAGIILMIAGVWRRFKVPA